MTTNPSIKNLLPPVYSLGHPGSGRLERSFTAAHGAVVATGLGVYRLSTELEGGRLPRWVDFIWLSFSTLTTAGFGDMTPVGSWPCAVAALEGLCGILYPATLIARIAAIPANGESGKCCW